MHGCNKWQIGKQVALTRKEKERGSRRRCRWLCDSGHRFVGLDQHLRLTRLLFLSPSMAAFMVESPQNPEPYHVQLACTRVHRDPSSRKNTDTRTLVRISHVTVLIWCSCAHDELSIESFSLTTVSCINQVESIHYSDLVIEWKRNSSFLPEIIGPRTS